MEYQTKYRKKTFNKKEYSYFVLGADIGGTNTNIGIFGIKKDKTEYLFSLHFQSRKLTSLIPAIKKTLEYSKNKHKITIKDACIAAAGVISMNRDICKITNLKWNINTNNIIKKTTLSRVFLINDFEAIGFGINLLDIKNKNDIIQVKHKIHQHKELKYATKAIIGAGTGLGKSILAYHDNYKAYIPIQSEGGHADFPAQNEFEIKILNFIKRKEKIKNTVSYGEIVAGKGIEVIYLFLKSQKGFKQTLYTKEVDYAQNKVMAIAKYKNKDKTCKETFRLYTIFYARCAKNFVLDTLARGGLYIAGGVASKNRELFKTKEFIKEFENAYKLSEVLKNTPIYIIVNYDVGMYGAALAAVTKKRSR